MTEDAKRLADEFERLAKAGSNLTCQFCSETDFDLIGLRMHIERGWCDVFEAIPNRDVSLDSIAAALRGEGNG